MGWSVLKSCWSWSGFDFDIWHVGTCGQPPSRQEIWNIDSPSLSAKVSHASDLDSRPIHKPAPHSCQTESRLGQTRKSSGNLAVNCPVRCVFRVQRSPELSRAVPLTRRPRKMCAEQWSFGVCFVRCIRHTRAYIYIYIYSNNMKNYINIDINIHVYIVWWYLPCLVVFHAQNPQLAPSCPTLTNIFRYGAPKLSPAEISSTSPKNADQAWVPQDLTWSYVYIYMYVFNKIKTQLL